MPKGAKMATPLKMFLWVYISNINNKIPPSIFVQVMTFVPGLHFWIKLVNEKVLRSGFEPTMTPGGSRETKKCWQGMTSLHFSSLRWAELSYICIYEYIREEPAEVAIIKLMALNIVREPNTTFFVDLYKHTGWVFIADLTNPDPYGRF